MYKRDKLVYVRTYVECYWLTDFINEFRKNKRYEDLTVALEDMLPMMCPEFIKVRICIVGEYTADIEVYIDLDELDRSNAPECRLMCRKMQCYRECINTEKGKKRCKYICVKRIISRCYIKCMKEARDNAIWWLKEVVEDIENALQTHGMMYEVKYDSKERPTKAKLRVITKRVEGRWMLS